MSVITTPDRRLQSALPYLSPHARIADVGTDHAYLPIYLVKHGLVSSALACDINRGPLESARANIAAAGLSDRIETRLTDGLHGVEASAPDHILIFGMGGELIIRILSEAPWIRDAGITLILQPMSRTHLLRAYLWENGFSIFGETLTYEDKYYRTLAARYTGVREAYTTEDCYLGRAECRNESLYMAGYLAHEIRVLESVISGKRRAANADTREEEALLRIFKTRLERYT